MAVEIFCLVGPNLKILLVEVFVSFPVQMFGPEDAILDFRVTVGARIFKCFGRLDTKEGKVNKSFA
jgi:hypothetical protein